MKNMQLVEALKLQQQETFLNPKQRAQLLSEIMICKATCYGLGDEKHADAVTKPGETLHKISNATDGQLYKAYLLFQIKINKLIREQRDRVNVLMGQKESLKADTAALDACYYLKSQTADKVA